MNINDNGFSLSCEGSLRSVIKRISEIFNHAVYVKAVDRLYLPFAQMKLKIFSYHVSFVSGYTSTF